MGHEEEREGGGTRECERDWGSEVAGKRRAAK